MNFKLDQLDGINSAFAARDPRPDCKLDYLSLSRSVPPPSPLPSTLSPRHPPTLRPLFFSVYLSPFFPVDTYPTLGRSSKLNGTIARNRGAADAPHLHNKSGKPPDMKS